MPDTYYRTVFDIANVEAENLTAADLGKWLAAQHHKRVADLMEKTGYGQILKKKRFIRSSCGRTTTLN